MCDMKDTDVKMMHSIAKDVLSLLKEKQLSVSDAKTILRIVASYVEQTLLQ